MNTQLQFAVLLTLLHGSTLSRESNRDRLLDRVRSRAEKLYHTRRQVAWTQCSDQPISSRASVKQVKEISPEGPPYGESNRGRRATSRSKDLAVFLDSSKGQWSSEQGIPDYNFTLAIWCRPEGGQDTPAIILEAEDVCSPFPDRGWSLGLHSPETSGEKNLRLYFKLHSWSKLSATVLTSPLPVKAGKWIHVAATFDGNTLTLYQNGAQVAVSTSQSCSPPTGAACRTLRLGGHAGSCFRGRLDDLRIWDTTFTKEIISELRFRKWPAHNPAVIDDFVKLDNWDWVRTQNKTQPAYRTPILLTSDIPSMTHIPIQPKENPCGFTVCDSPEISRSYRDHWTLRKFKVLRYRVVILSEDDGSNPIVTKEQVRTQHEYLLKAYERYNISWQLDEFHVMNSSLRKRSILLSCHASMVGNGNCDPECRHPSTGNDGGDCGGANIESFVWRNQISINENVDMDDGCQPEFLGNEICDPICNVAAYEWDGGDCCLEKSSSSCYDPQSPRRTYMDVREFKSLLKMKNLSHINVFFAHWTNRDILGVATFPWEKNVYTEYGGIILQPSGYGLPGHMSTLVHELGHALGLWHVHRGVSEMDCSHPCFEREPSPFHGDLCEDTKPTPENLQCHDPPIGTSTVCGRSKFMDTPYTNYMGYADDACVSDFTPEQVARMHCHIDLVYNSARATVKDASTAPSPPLSLSAISSTPSSVTLSWIPPLATDAFYDTSVCSFCSSILEYTQFAHRAESNEVGEGFSEMWAPNEATGPPDSESCVLSYKIWLPDAGRCPNDICTLTVYFDKPSVPSLLQVWITWNAHKGLSEIELVFQDGSSQVLTHLPAQCDSPLSLPLLGNNTLTKVNIRTSRRFVGVDAVKMVSTANNPICAPCKPLRYRISRDPPFATAISKEVDYPMFTDSDLEAGTTYTYRVQSWLANHVTSFSPAFVHVAGSSVCGDGEVDGIESCDDGNMSNGDGCSSSCETEEFYHCSEKPSVCYWHDSDGRCEDFERDSSPSDCGFFTPQGFTDQWARTLEAGPKEFTASCPPDMIAGPPRLPFTCRSDQFLESSWSPCEFQLDTEFWLAAKFPKPVVATSVLLYLTSDGADSGPFQEPSMSTLRLLDSQNIPHHEMDIELSCTKSPQEIVIFKDLSRPFVKTAAMNLSFTNIQIEVAAIKLRSSNSLNPVEIAECAAGEQYHPGLQLCDKYCQMSACPKLPAKHAHLNCSGEEDGDVCFVVCNPGHHRPNNLPPLVCQAGQWIGPDPHCKPIDCGTPLLAHADIICPDGTTYGRTCSYKCRPPARFVGGGSGLATISCEASGKWSTPNLICQLSCLPPSSHAHAVLASVRCRKAESFLFGQTCRYRCKVGYHVEGHTTRKRILYLRCDLTGSWSGPKCVPVTCDPIENLLHSCSSGNSAGSECKVTCSKQELTSLHRCELDGSWHPVLPKCETLHTCPPPQTSSSNLQFLCEDNTVGAVCKATCIDPEEQPVRIDEVDRIRIRCDINRRWVPDPTEIQCKKKCVPNYLRDGYCDATNNQPHCNYDSGDCCASTALFRTVKPFPHNCGEPCSCLDPQAIENEKPQN